MLEIGLGHYLTLGAIIFTIGVCILTIKGSSRFNNEGNKK